MSFIYKPEDSQTKAPAATSGAPLRVALPPNVAVAGWPAAAGSNALAGYQPLEDATIAARLRQGGATLVGYTAMSEFGLSLFGSAAGQALAQGAADVEIVPDLLGEARHAAIQANVCGLKPGFGTISRCGVTQLMPSLESSAILAATPQAIGAVLASIGGADPRDPSLPKDCDATPPPAAGRKITLGVVENICAALESGAAAAVAARLARLRDAGIAVKRVTLPEFALYATAHQIIGGVEASSAAGRYDSVRFGSRPANAKNWNEMFLSARNEAFGAQVKSLLLQGALFQFERRQAYDDACRIRARLTASFSAALAGVDALLLPVVAVPPPAAMPSLADTYNAFTATLPANLNGAAALTLPPHEGVALQLLGGRRAAATLLALGEHLLKI